MLNEINLPDNDVKGYLTVNGYYGRSIKVTRRDSGAVNIEFMSNNVLQGRLMAGSDGSLKYRNLISNIETTLAQ